MVSEKGRLEIVHDLGPWTAPGPNNVGIEGMLVRGRPVRPAGGEYKLLIRRLDTDKITAVPEYGNLVSRLTLFCTDCSCTGSPEN